MGKNTQGKKLQQPESKICCNVCVFAQIPISPMAFPVIGPCLVWGIINDKI